MNHFRQIFIFISYFLFLFFAYAHEPMDFDPGDPNDLEIKPTVEINQSTCFPFPTGRMPSRSVYFNYPRSPSYRWQPQESKRKSSPSPSLFDFFPFKQIKNLFAMPAQAQPQVEICIDDLGKKTIGNYIIRAKIDTVTVPVNLGLSGPWEKLLKVACNDIHPNCNESYACTRFKLPVKLEPKYVAMARKSFRDYAPRIDGKAPECSKAKNVISVPELYIAGPLPETDDIEKKCDQPDDPGKNQINIYRWRLSSNQIKDLKKDPNLKKEVTELLLFFMNQNFHEGQHAFIYKTFLENKVVNEVMKAPKWKKLTANSDFLAQQDIAGQVDKYIRDRIKILKDGAGGLEEFQERMVHTEETMSQDIIYYCRACQKGDENEAEVKKCYSTNKATWEARTGKVLAPYEAATKMLHDEDLKKDYKDNPEFRDWQWE